MSRNRKNEPGFPRAFQVVALVLALVIIFALIASTCAGPTVYAPTS